MNELLFNHFLVIKGSLLKPTWIKLYAHVNRKCVILPAVYSCEVFFLSKCSLREVGSVVSYFSKDFFFNVSVSSNFTSLHHADMRGSFGLTSRCPMALVLFSAMSLSVDCCPFQRHSLTCPSIFWFPFSLKSSCLSRFLLLPHVSCLCALLNKKMSHSWKSTCILSTLPPCLLCVTIY